MRLEQRLVTIGDSFPVYKFLVLYRKCDVQHKESDGFGMVLENCDMRVFVINPVQ